MPSAGWHASLLPADILFSFWTQERRLAVAVTYLRLRWLTVGVLMNSPVPRHAFLHGIETSSSSFSLREMKARQSRKIQELRKALCAGGPVSFCEQAALLGLCRSTTWAVLMRPYKSSGMTAAVINRMLASQKLPSQARTIIFEYIAEKGGGLYGHSRSQCRKFISRLSPKENGREFRLIEHNVRSENTDKSNRHDHAGPFEPSRNAMYGTIKV